jgi:hypothetical protein
MDEGASFQKQPVPFLVETLIFHPKEEDKVLAYTKESKVRGHRPGARSRGPKCLSKPYWASVQLEGHQDRDSLLHQRLRALPLNRGPHWGREAQTPLLSCLEPECCPVSHQE